MSRVMCHYFFFYFFFLFSGQSGETTQLSTGLPFMLNFFVQALKRVEMGGKIAVFLISIIYLLCYEQHNFCIWILSYI